MPDPLNISLSRSMRDFRIPVIKHAAIRAAEMQSEVMHNLMSGDATFIALKHAVNEITNSAPPDHDVVVHAFGIYISNIEFLQPHTLVLSGFDESGNRAVVVAHYTQMVAHVVYMPKRGPERIITGFSVQSETPTV